MSERIAICDEQRKGPVNLSKRRHEDLDADPHEGEKRQRVTDLPGAGQGQSIRIMPLSDRSGGITMKWWLQKK